MINFFVRTIDLRSPGTYCSVFRANCWLVILKPERRNPPKSGFKGKIDHEPRKFLSGKITKPMTVEFVIVQFENNAHHVQDADVRTEPAPRPVEQLYR